MLRTAMQYASAFLMLTLMVVPASGQVLYMVPVQQAPGVDIAATQGIAAISTASLICGAYAQTAANVGYIVDCSNTAETPKARQLRAYFSSDEVCSHQQWRGFQTFSAL